MLSNELCNSMTYSTQELVPQDSLPSDFLHAVKNSDYSSVSPLNW